MTIQELHMKKMIFCIFAISVLLTSCNLFKKQEEQYKQAGNIKVSAVMTKDYYPLPDSVPTNQSENTNLTPSE